MEHPNPNTTLPQNNNEATALPPPSSLASGTNPILGQPTLFPGHRGLSHSRSHNSLTSDTPYPRTFVSPPVQADNPDGPGTFNNLRRSSSYLDLRSLNFQPGNPYNNVPRFNQMYPPAAHRSSMDYRLPTFPMNHQPPGFMRPSPTLSATGRSYANVPARRGQGLQPQPTIRPSGPAPPTVATPIRVPRIVLRDDISESDLAALTHSCTVMINDVRSRPTPRPSLAAAHCANPFRTSEPTLYRLYQADDDESDVDERFPSGPGFEEENDTFKVIPERNAIIRKPGKAGQQARQEWLDQRTAMLRDNRDDAREAREAALTRRLQLAGIGVMPGPIAPQPGTDRERFLRGRSGRDRGA
ncbi:hypothetical protein EDC01DRAFT_370487 [Geopyxis carbonaria]|nr:hypothetical protein EDC01DRAFT_370487 [Geopyxis carbonaria]